MSAELLGRSASELTQDLAARRIRATELMAACLARVEEANPALDAICTVDGEAALAAAADCDRRLESGVSPRALEGIPFLAKDNLATKGVRTTFGAVPFADHVPSEDAICVERLKAAPPPPGDPTGSDARERRGRPTRLGGPRRAWERPVEAARAGRSPR